MAFRQTIVTVSTRPGQDRDKTGTRPGEDREKTGTRPGIDRDKTGRRDKTRTPTRLEPDSGKIWTRLNKTPRLNNPLL